MKVGDIVRYSDDYIKREIALEGLSPRYVNFLTNLRAKVVSVDDDMCVIENIQDLNDQDDCQDWELTLVKEGD